MCGSYNEYIAKWHSDGRSVHAGSIPAQNSEDWWGAGDRQGNQSLMRRTVSYAGSNPAVLLQKIRMEKLVMKKKTNLGGALRTALFLTAASHYATVVKEERATKAWQEKEAKRIERMKESRTWLRILLGYILLLIFVILFT